MAIFNEKRTIYGHIDNIEYVLNDVKLYFEAKKFEVHVESNLDSGFISITKGGIFKSVTGLKVALNTSLKIQNDNVFVESKIGAFGSKVAVLLVGVYVIAWPLAVSAALGMILQTNLNKEMMEQIAKSIYFHSNKSISNTSRTYIEENRTCTGCGCILPSNADYCSECGKKITVV